MSSKMEKFMTHRTIVSMVIGAAHASFARVAAETHDPVINHLGQCLLAASEGRWRAAAEWLELAARADREAE